LKEGIWGEREGDLTDNFIVLRDFSQDPHVRRQGSGGTLIVVFVLLVGGENFWWRDICAGYLGEGHFWWRDLFLLVGWRPLLVERTLLVGRRDL